MLEERAALFASLADPIRLQVVNQLGSGKKCVCELQKVIDAAPNLLSYHLRVLREAGVVTASRRGRWIDYELDHRAVARLRAALPGDDS